MDYLLTEEQRLLQELALQVAEERIKPVRAELDEHEIFPQRADAGNGPG